MPRLRPTLGLESLDGTAKYLENPGAVENTPRLFFRLQAAKTTSNFNFTKIEK